MCTEGTGGIYPELQFFANMKLQLPHHRGGFGFTPCADSATSAFYASTASLVWWLGHHGNAQQDLANLADVWAPGQDMSNPDAESKMDGFKANSPDNPATKVQPRGLPGGVLQTARAPDKSLCIGA